MYKTAKTGLTVLLGIFLSTSAISQRKKTEVKPMELPMTSTHWTKLSENAEFISYKGTQAVQSSDDKAYAIWTKEFEFTDGTIEYDVELKGQGFPSIYYRISADTVNYETFYIRYFGTPDPKLRTATQYTAVVDGVNLWDMTDDYQAAVNLTETGWNHVKLVIHGKQMRVYVNDMDKPALWVPAMEGITDKGRIGFVGNVIFANVTVTPNATEDLPAMAGYDPTYNDSRYLRKWQVTQPVDYSFGKDLLEGIPVSPGVQIDSTYLPKNATWKTITTDRRALVNLTKEFGGTKTRERRLTWLKTTIKAEKEIEKLLRLGFSDEVWVFINGKPLYQDRNFYGSPGMKFPKGRTNIENSAFTLPLQEGDNELLIGLSNYFYGWGIIARMEDTDGVWFE